MWKVGRRLYLPEATVLLLDCFCIEFEVSIEQYKNCTITVFLSICHPNMPLVKRSEQLFVLMFTINNAQMYILEVIRQFH